MPDKKLTDNEIIKALECEIELAKNIGDNTAYMVELSILTSALALINRQNAEIERLKNEQKLFLEKSIEKKYPYVSFVNDGIFLSKLPEEYNKLISNISHQVIEEFVEILKEKTFILESPFEANEDKFIKLITVKSIDNAVRERYGNNV